VFCAQSDDVEPKQCLYQPERSLELLAGAEALDPFLPAWCLEERSVVLFNLGRHKEAITALNRLAFQTVRSRSYVAAFAIVAGDKESARNTVAEAIGISPGLTASKVVGAETYRYPDDANRPQRLLVEAGLPE
jgi:adenylate cyclase